MTLKIIYKDINNLIPYVNNARTHSDEQILQVASSIKEFGFTNPVLIDEQGGIIAGHGRVMAAKKLGLTEVPTITLANLTEGQKKAYVLADNQIALNSGWDLDMLRLEIETLAELDFDLNLIGFDENAIEKLLDVDAEMPDLPDGDRDPFQQKTFSLHDEQASIIDDALLKAKTSPLIDTGLNDNGNANALTFICEQWLKQNGKR